MKLLVTEKSGSKISSITNFIDPHTPNFCGRNKCFVCDTAEGEETGNCWQEGIGYEIICKICRQTGTRAVYWGETGFSGHYRGNFHREGLQNSDPENALYKHNLECHPARKLGYKDFKMTVKAKFKTPTIRQAFEGISLEKEVERREKGDNIIVLNSKSEFHQPAVVRQYFSKVIQ